jgi:hypothetical protein
MINSDPEEINPDEPVDNLVAAGAHGALTLAGIATACVVGIWFAFYLFVFLPRGTLQ